MSRVQIVGEERLTTEKLKERFARNLTDYLASWVSTDYSTLLKA